MGVFRVLCVMVVVGFTGISSGAVAAPAPSFAQVVAPVQAPVAVPAPAPAPVVEPPAAVAAPRPPAAPARVAGTPCSAAARACADLSSKQAWLIRNGAIEFGPVPIVHGRKGFETPVGTSRVFYKNRNHVSSIYDVAMPNAVFFNGDIAFHQGQLRGGSHGCIRLSRGAAQKFFAGLNRGDVVQVVR